jgi:hypothetical protein
MSAAAKHSGDRDVTVADHARLTTHPVSPADKVLGRLRQVKRTGPGRWIASCPTREDRHPSLAVRELDDGRILLHDFGGDDVAEILASIGLDLRDLFPTNTGGSPPTQRPFSASGLLDMVATECSVAVVVCADVLRSRAISEADFTRLLTAAQRLGHSAEVCRGRR